MIYLSYQIYFQMWRTTMMNTNQFEEIRATLEAVMIDPIAHQEALDECESLYQELFVGAGSEMSGKDIVEGREWDDESLIPLLEERARYELDYENAAVAASCSNLTIQEEYAKIAIKRFNDELAEQAAIRQAFHDDCFVDYYSEPESLLDYMDEREIKDLYHNVLNSTYVCLVNYKGEPEIDVLKDAVPHLRTFVTKYNYL